MTTVCPNCYHKEPDGAFFCSECGTKLVSEGGLSTATIRGTDSRLQANRPVPPSPSAVMDATEASVSLHIVRSGQILPLVGRTDFTIGRVSEGQSILPDIDLSPYEAYSQGVSRLHATIRVEPGGVRIIDLGSSNGTRVNNAKLPPHSDQMLKHGDIIALGQFKIQALIRQE